MLLRRRLRLGTTLTIAVRTLAMLLALLAGIAASIILARRLSSYEYAAYQTLSKRVMGLASTPLTLLQGWMLRYTAQGYPGTWEAWLVASAATVIVVLAAQIYAGVWLGLNPGIALLAGLGFSGLAAYYSLRNIINAVRPLRYGVLELIQRASYSLLVVVLVYVVSAGLQGALVSVLASALAGAGLAWLWLRGVLGQISDRREWRRVLGEWLRGLHVTGLGAFTAALLSLDVFILYYFYSVSGKGSIIVAGYFASLVPFVFLAEGLSAGLSYIGIYLLSGGSVERTLMGLQASGVLVAPLLAYSMLYPLHVIYLVNPGYSWASAAIVVHAASTYLQLQQMYLGNMIGGSIRGRVGEASSKLLVLSLIGLASAVVYIALLSAMALIAAGELWLITALWALARLLSFAVNVLLLLYIAPRELRRLYLNSLARSLPYLGLALLLSALIPPLGAPRPRFFEEVMVLAPAILAVMAATYLASLADPRVRASLTRLLRELLA